MKSIPDSVIAARCRRCGSAQVAERCPGGAEIYAVWCPACGASYLTNNPAAAFVDLDVPREPQMRWPRQKSDCA